MEELLDVSTHKRYKDVMNNRPVKITKYDMHPIDFNRDTMLLWLVDCGWVDAYVVLKVGNKKAWYLDDYKLIIWVLIIELADRLVKIFQEEGKGKFTNYIKMLINNNVHSDSSRCYDGVRKHRELDEVYFNDSGWLTINDNFNQDDLVYRLIKYTAENPLDNVLYYDNENLVEIAYDKRLYKKATK